jgi:hypothetical protein
MGVNAIHAGSTDADPANWKVTREMMEGEGGAEGQGGLDFKRGKRSPRHLVLHPHQQVPPTGPRCHRLTPQSLGRRASQDPSSTRPNSRGADVDRATFKDRTEGTRIYGYQHSP